MEIEPQIFDRAGTLVGEDTEDYSIICVLITWTMCHVKWDHIRFEVEETAINVTDMMEAPDKLSGILSFGWYDVANASHN